VIVNVFKETFQVVSYFLLIDEIATDKLNQKPVALPHE
jgi:hypothetical protein